MGLRMLLLERQSQWNLISHHHCMLRAQLEQSHPALQASSSLAPLQTALYGYMDHHPETWQIARLGELWTCPAHPVTVLHKADRL